MFAKKYEKVQKMLVFFLLNFIIGTVHKLRYTYFDTQSFPIFSREVTFLANLKP